MTAAACACRPRGRPATPSSAGRGWCSSSGSPRGAEIEPGGLGSAAVLWATIWWSPPCRWLSPNPSWMSLLRLEPSSKLLTFFFFFSFSFPRLLLRFFFFLQLIPLSPPPPPFPPAQSLGSVRAAPPPPPPPPGLPSPSPRACPAASGRRRGCTELEADLSLALLHRLDRSPAAAASLPFSAACSVACSLCMGVWRRERRFEGKSPSSPAAAPGRHLREAVGTAGTVLYSK